MGCSAKQVSTALLCGKNGGGGGVEAFDVPGFLSHPCLFPSKSKGCEQSVVCGFLSHPPFCLVKVGGVKVLFENILQKKNNYF